MRRIFLTKKAWEASALRAAKSREEEQSKTSDANADDDDAREREELSDERARGDATNRANGVRDGLSRLFLRQTELEKTVQEWNERMVEYERSSSREGADELDRLRRDHDDEIDRLLEKARVENEIDEEELKAAAAGGKGKRTAKGGEDEDEQGWKRQRVGYSTTEGGDEDARNADAKNSATGTGEKVSASVQKEEELKVRINLQFIRDREGGGREACNSRMMFCIVFSPCFPLRKNIYIENTG